MRNGNDSSESARATRCSGDKRISHAAVTVARESLPVVNSRVARRSRASDEETRAERTIRRRLAKRSYHLPGYSWCDDWQQYMLNTHPLLGICCHHKLHPLKIGQRIICLIGSIAFGLVATNSVILYYALNKEENIDETLFRLSITSNTTDISPRFQSVEVTEGMVALWTFGGFFHSVFDLTIWYASACSCCLPGGSCDWFGCFRMLGAFIVVGIVMVTVAIATFMVVWRASRMSYLRDMEDLGIDDVEFSYYIQWSEIDNLDNFSFLLGYCVELGLALFAYYPLLGTILFSGVLGCGKLPFLGGRPLEVKQELAKRQRRAGKGSCTKGTRRTNTGSTIRTNTESTIGTNTVGEVDWGNEDWYGP